ncbi:hypothetical protein AM571_CH01157 [Rhizobium etli 8C-3]|uniref:Uncharacterized protein n=1 Tax=Rhizobium etli 8C-3 TaxID=538025 RepID=A0A1L5P1F8_RHIET|nr:hypothetical protein AM571_CH01157 [Rhizobium etli 8C-3]
MGTPAEAPCPAELQRQSRPERIFEVTSRAMGERVGALAEEQDWRRPDHFLHFRAGGTKKPGSRPGFCA